MNGICTGTIFGSPPPGALGRGQNFNFLNMVMWHIKLKRMSSRPGYQEKLIKLVTLVTIRVLRERGDLRWSAIDCVLVKIISLIDFNTKIRNRYNQVPHLTQDTNGKVTISQ